MAGYTQVADGIGTRPVYDYDPGAAFFDPGTPTGPNVFNILDFGAIADPSVDNRPMIQAAIEAAADNEGGIVYIPPGVFGISADPTNEGAVQVYSNVFLKGAGMGQSTLRLVDGSSGDITGLVRSPWGEETDNWGIADFTIDGNQSNTTGKVDGFFTGPEPGQTIADSDVYVSRVEIMEVSRYGFDPHELTQRLTINDSVAHNNGVDGFVFDRIVEGEFSGNEAYENGRHGFNVVTTSEDLVFTDNVSHDNGGGGFVIQRGSEDIAPSHNIVLEGGASYDNGREGVLVQMAHDVVVSGVDVYGNGMSGVRLFGAKDVIVENNQIHDNSQSKHDGFSEVEIQDYIDNVFFHTFEPTGNTVTGNTIYSQSPVKSSYGIETVGDVESAFNVIEGGDGIFGTARGGVGLLANQNSKDITGSRFDDTIVGTDEYDVINGFEGNDLIYAKDGFTDLVAAGAGDDTVHGGKGMDEIYGQDGNDNLNGDSDNDHLFGNAGNDTLNGGSGEDYLNGGDGNDVINGGSGQDTLVGEAGNDELRGGSGNDILLGGLGDDKVYGGSGDDTIAVEDDAGDDLFNGGSGVDELDLRGVNVGLEINASKKTITGAGNDTFKSIESIRGTYLDDTYRGNDGVSTFNGDAGNDEIRGAGGADQFTGGAGDDTYVYLSRDILDGNGNHRGVDTISDYEIGDTINVSQITRGNADFVRAVSDGSGTMVSVSINGTFQDVVYLDGFTDAANVNILGDDGLNGTSADDYLSGSAGNDEIHGGDGNDTLKGNDGVDKLYGEAGDDIMRGGAGNDAFNGGAGNDDMRGGSGNDGFYGGGGNDYIKGDSGNDTVFGDGGDDTIIGGSGADSLHGGSGHDDIKGGSNDDQLFGDAGDDVLNGNSGNDQIFGGAGSDQLFGQKGDDVFDGGDGDDVVSGGSGDDIIFAGAGFDVVDGDGGFDTLDFSNLTMGADINASSKTATDSVVVSTSFDSIEKFVGSNFDDNYRGNDKVDVFLAGSGNDTIRAAGGSDILTGGEGDDTYIYFARDVVDGAGAHRGVDSITDYEVGDVIDVRDIAKGDSDAVRLTSDGSDVTVSVEINGAFQDVAVLGGVQNVDSVSVMIGDELFA